MSETETGQINKSAAEIYEDFFLPALFNEWPPRVIAQAAVQPGQRVLDVACGTGTARFPSIAGWVFTDIKGWTLADMIDEAQYEQLLTEAEKEFQPFVDDQGQVSFPAPAHIVTAVKD